MCRREGGVSTQFSLMGRYCTCNIFCETPRLPIICTCKLFQDCTCLICELCYSHFATLYICKWSWDWYTYMFVYLFVGVGRLPWGCHVCTAGGHWQSDRGTEALWSGPGGGASTHQRAAHSVLSKLPLDQWSAGRLGFKWQKTPWSHACT